MNWSVHLDDKSGSVAVEVGNEAVDDLVAAEVEALQLVSAQCSPELRFCRRHFLPELLGANELTFADALTLNNAAVGHDTVLHSISADVDSSSLVGTRRILVQPRIL